MVRSDQGIVKVQWLSGKAASLGPGDDGGDGGRPRASLLRRPCVRDSTGRIYTKITLFS